MRSRLTCFISAFFALLITLSSLAGTLIIKAPPPGFVDLRSVMPDACVVIPYAMSDYATTFATVPLEELLAAME